MTTFSDDRGPSHRAERVLPPSERPYRCVAASVAGLIQQVAVSYIRTGHFFYVCGELKPQIDPADVDAKLIRKYGVDATRWERALRKSRGEANLQYIRCGRFFLLMATHGKSLFFELEGDEVKDCRRQPIKFAGYSLSYRNGHPHVRLDLSTYLGFKALMSDLATNLDRRGLEELLAMPRFVPYAPVRRQLLNVVREVNRVRAAAGLEQIDVGCLPLRRAIVRPFGDEAVVDKSPGRMELKDAAFPQVDLSKQSAQSTPADSVGGVEATPTRPPSQSTIFPESWSCLPDPEPKTTMESRTPGGPDRPRGMER